MRRKKSKIPKLKKGDRIKIIDRADLLIVQPLTHAASIRYGHLSKWCTSTGNKSTFTNHIVTETLVYCIFYELTEDNKRGAEKTKIAISKPKKSRRYQRVTCYDRFDCSFNLELVQTLLNKNDFEILIEFLKIKIGEITKQKVKQQTSEFAVGDLIKCSGDRMVKLEFQQYEEERWLQHLARSTASWNKNARYKRNNFLKFGLVFKVKKCEIESAIITKVFDKSIEIKIVSLARSAIAYSVFIAHYDITTRMNMNTQKEVHLIKYK